MFLWKSFEFIFREQRSNHPKKLHISNCFRCKGIFFTNTYYLGALGATDLPTIRYEWLVFRWFIFSIFDRLLLFLALNHLVAPRETIGQRCFDRRNRTKEQNKSWPLFNRLPCIWPGAEMQKTPINAKNVKRDRPTNRQTDRAGCRVVQHATKKNIPV